MRYVRLIFWLPLIAFQGIALLFPFKSRSYQPSTEAERKVSEDIRNTTRLFLYKMRKLNHQ